MGVLAGGVIMSCIAAVVHTYMLASLQYRDEARRVSTDQAGIACTKGMEGAGGGGGGGEGSENMSARR